MSKSRLPHPTCPTCNYDLTGIEPDKANRLTCPECNAFTSFDSATQIVSRWRNIQRASVWILIAPILIMCIGWVELQTMASPLILFVFGFISLFYLPLASFLLTMDEREFRRKTNREHASPSYRIVLGTILLMTMISLLICGYSYIHNIQILPTM